MRRKVVDYSRGKQSMWNARRLADITVIQILPGKTATPITTVWGELSLSILALED